MLLALGLTEVKIDLFITNVTTFSADGFEKRVMLVNGP